MSSDTIRLTKNKSGKAKFFEMTQKGGSVLVGFGLVGGKEFRKTVEFDNSEDAVEYVIKTKRAKLSQQYKLLHHKKKEEHREFSEDSMDFSGDEEKVPDFPTNKIVFLERSDDQSFYELHLDEDVLKTRYGIVGGDVTKTKARLENHNAARCLMDDMIKKKCAKGYRVSPNRFENNMSSSSPKASAPTSSSGNKRRSDEIDSSGSNMEDETGNGGGAETLRIHLESESRSDKGLKFYILDLKEDTLTTKYGKDGKVERCLDTQLGTVEDIMQVLEETILAKIQRGYTVKKSVIPRKHRNFWKGVAQKSGGKIKVPKYAERTVTRHKQKRRKVDNSSKGSTQTSDLRDGEEREVQGSGDSTYTIKNVAGVYSCSCWRWRHQRLKIDQRTCKHLQQLRGRENEEKRVGEITVKRKKAGVIIAPSVLLAKKFESKKDPTGWMISEKLDGVRAWWDGTRFLSREGNEYFAPDFFIDGFPDHSLDGELWLGRGQFQKCVGIVRRANGGKFWEDVKYMVFDAPEHPGPFEDRIKIVHKSVKTCKYAEALDHYECRGLTHLEEELEKIETLGGEGLMLRQAGSRYIQGRSSTLLKVKTFHDDEAVVTGHQGGKGKHTNRMGALLCRNINGKNFKVGTGFSDRERDNPPLIGSVITYKYQELTKAGIPRFPVFIRMRPDVDPF